jgi:wyosine [tRNA(Phe)-imidazoG37] synthetase (radical SAM superfamily)
MNTFFQMRKDVIEESKKFDLSNLPDTERRLTAGCAKCANYQMKEWSGGDGLIHFVNFSMYPAPCQCKCIYCIVRNTDKRVPNKGSEGVYFENLFDTLEYAVDNGMIADNAIWQVSSGEITIHPYRERIFDLVRDKAARFYTNCFKFDEAIAENLKSNPHSAINLSIDAGTPATWRAIKGVDNFEQVTENLVKYYASSSRPGQITLKYIIMPDINDTYEDFLSVIEIMKILGRVNLEISRDVRQKYSSADEYAQNLIGAAGYLIAMLHKNGRTFTMYTFSPEEREQVVAFANELLENDIV